MRQGHNACFMAQEGLHAARLCAGEFKRCHTSLSGGGARGRARPGGWNEGVV